MYFSVSSFWHPDDMINYTVWSYRESSTWQVNLELKFNTLPVLKNQDHTLFTNIFRWSLKLRICRIICLDTLLVRELMFARDQMMLLIDMMTCSSGWWWHLSIFLFQVYVADYDNGYFFGLNVSYVIDHVTKQGNNWPSPCVEEQIL